MKYILAIVGPTATSKTETAIYLAQCLNGEIVNADSRQVYRYMDIGTAKSTPEQRRLVRHHLIDIINPDDDFSLAVYQDLAYQAIAHIYSRNKIPLLVGGSGLYVWSVLEGWRIPQVPANEQLREKLAEMSRIKGREILYNELLLVDPESAEAIAPENTRRVIRALEIFYTTGTPASKLKDKNPPDFNPIIVGLTRKREELYKKVDNRVDEMVARGLVEETQELLKRGYIPDLRAMSGIGYKEMVLYLKGIISLEAAFRQIKKATRRLVRHQYAWFRLDDPRIKWFDITLSEKSIVLEWIMHRLGSYNREYAAL